MAERVKWALRNVGWWHERKEAWRDVVEQEDVGRRARWACVAAESRLTPFWRSRGWMLGKAQSLTQAK